MYLHVGWNEIIATSEVLAVCDYESWKQSCINSSTMDLARVAGKVRRITSKRDHAKETVRSVIVCRDEVIFSPITASTLQARVSKMAADFVRT